MSKLTKTITIEEAVKKSKSNPFFDALLSIFPNQAGINLCCIKDITFKCTNDKYGQLTDLQISFVPGTDYDGIESNGGPWPWLKIVNNKVEFGHEN